MDANRNELQRSRSKSMPAIGAFHGERPLFSSMKVRRRPTPNPSTTGVVTPTLSVKHGENHVELTAELPGIQPSDVQVEVRKNLLHIYVVKTEDGSDRTLGTYSEAFRLPPGLDMSTMKTIGTDGKYVITINKECNDSTSFMESAVPHTSEATATPMQI